MNNKLYQDIFVNKNQDIINNIKIILHNPPLDIDIFIFAMFGCEKQQIDKLIIQMIKDKLRLKDTIFFPHIYNYMSCISCMNIIPAVFENKNWDMLNDMMEIGLLTDKNKFKGDFIDINYVGSFWKKIMQIPNVDTIIQFIEHLPHQIIQLVQHAITACNDVVTVPLLDYLSKQKHFYINETTSEQTIDASASNCLFFVSRKRSRRFTTFQLAVMANNILAVKWYAEHGASLFYCNGAGNDPIVYAYYYKRKEIKNFLLEYYNIEKRQRKQMKVLAVDLRD